MTISEARFTRGDHRAAEMLLKGRTAELTPNVDSPVLLRDEDTDRPIALVLRCPEDLLGELRRAMLSFPMSTTLRSSGMRNRSSVFGFTARNAVLRREGCRPCNSEQDAAEAHATIVGAAATFAAMLAEYVPEQAQQDAALSAAQILPAWHMAGTQWTSGVLNETSELRYHYDRNNMHTWNAMVVARRGTRGGHFHVPEYDIVLPCRDGDVCFFPAYGLVHGVTPIRKTDPDGYRYSAVYYTVARMRECLEPEAEMEYGRQARTTREDTLIERQRASGLMS